MREGLQDSNMPVLLAIERNRHRAHPLEIALLECLALLLPEEGRQNGGKCDEGHGCGKQQKTRLRANAARSA